MLVYREVADRLPVVEHGLLGLIARGGADVEIQRRHAPLDVQVVDDEVVALVVH